MAKSKIYGALAGLCLVAGGCAGGGTPSRDGGFASAGIPSGASSGPWGPEDTDGYAEIDHDELSATWSLVLDGAERPEIDVSGDGLVVLRPDAMHVEAYGADGAVRWSTPLNFAGSPVALAGDGGGGATVAAFEDAASRLRLARIDPFGGVAWTGTVETSTARPSHLSVANFGGGNVVLGFDHGPGSTSELVFTDPDGLLLSRRGAADSGAVLGLTTNGNYALAYGTSAAVTGYSSFGDRLWSDLTGIQVRGAWTDGNRIVLGGWIGGVTCTVEYEEKYPNIGGTELPDYEPVAATQTGHPIGIDGRTVLGATSWTRTWSFQRPGQTPQTVIAPDDLPDAYVLSATRTGWIIEHLDLTDP